MTEAFKQQIEQEARQAVTELLEQAKLKKGDVFVVGCSSSEIVGGHIGKDSSLEAAQAVYAGIAPVLAAQGTTRAAAGPPPAGSSSMTRSLWKRSRPMRASTSAALSSGCTSSGWPCRCA